MTDFDKCVCLLQMFYENQKKNFEEYSYSPRYNFPIKNKRSLEILKTFQEYDEAFFNEIRDCASCVIVYPFRNNVELDATLRSFFEC
jgi:hypothetical protein